MECRVFIGNDFNWLVKHLNIRGQDDRTEKEDAYFVQTIEVGDRSIYSVISFGLFAGEVK